MRKRDIEAAIAAARAAGLPVRRIVVADDRVIVEVAGDDVPAADRPGEVNLFDQLLERLEHLTAVETVFVGRDRQYNRRFLRMCGHYVNRRVTAR
ncbi:MAG TPA: hypothetical protein VFW75_02620 [Acetobacteraceae bacterium]|nr:hypothetical protein [Acetobacteraceae bacterium]